MRYAVAEFWRMWTAGRVANAMVLVQLKDGEWRILADAHEPLAKQRSRLPPGAGRLRDLEGNPSASRPSRHSRTSRSAEVQA
jgi:hypothetical protein